MLGWVMSLTITMVVTLNGYGNRYGGHSPMSVDSVPVPVRNSHNITIAV